jgi:Mg/Co/Ni transporter MgtE
MPTELETASATEHLWERWHSLSHRDRIKQFRELHTGGKADFFLELSAHDQPLPEMIRKRAGWLAILFIGEMFTATAMGFFEDEIAKAVVLALFLPLIISSGGDSGSQATSLVIQAMALGDIRLRDWFRVIRRELISGLALGLILGIIGLTRIFAWQKLFGTYGPQAPILALTILCALNGVVTFGTIAGSMLPAAMWPQPGQCIGAVCGNTGRCDWTHHLLHDCQSHHAQALKSMARN